MSNTAQFHELTVADVTPLCEDAVAITFAVPDELRDEFAFSAGQSLTVRQVVDGVEERRSYSICAPVGSAPRIGVREVPSGRISPWLVHDLRRGDRVQAQRPSGSFTPPPDAHGHHVLIVAGSGITPAMSIASTLLAVPDCTVTAIYGNRRANTVMFADELCDLKDRFPERVEIVHVLSREPRESDLFSGRLDGPRIRDLVARLTDPAEVAHWWLCGPFGMVSEARAVLGEMGIDRSRVHVELFYVEDVPPEGEHHVEAPPTGVTTDVTVVLDGRATTFTMPRDETVLDAAQRVRPDLPFACKGGVCGTCRARVVAGEVVMRRNFALEPDEVQDGFVLTCQSHPTTDDITVDYDA